VKGCGKQVVCPGSVHAATGRRYRWEGGPPAELVIPDAPAALLEELAAPAAPAAPAVTYERRDFDGELPPRVAEILERFPNPRARFEGDAEGLKDMSRSGPAMSLANHLALRGCDGAEIDAALRHMWPGKGERAYELTVQKALAHAAEQRGADPHEVFEPYIAAAKAGAQEKPAEDLDRRAAIFAKQMTPIVEFVKRPIARPVLEGVMVDGINLWVGAGGAGKTHAAFSFGLSVSAGHQTWLDRPLRISGPVAYFSAEGEDHLVTRGRAWEKYRGEPLPKDFYAMHGGLRLADREVRKNVHAYLEKLRPAAFILDTFSAATGGIDENSAGEVGVILDWVREGVYRTGAVAIVVHHSGWSNAGRARGSGVLEANLDGVITIANGVLRPKKLRRGRGRPLGFGFKSIALDEDPAYPGVELEDSVVVARGLDPTLEIVAMVELLGDEKGWPLPLKVAAVKKAEQSGDSEDAASERLKAAIPEGEKNADPSTGLYRARGEGRGKPWMIYRGEPAEGQ
jgi:hypothetical protein